MKLIRLPLLLLMLTACSQVDSAGGQDSADPRPPNAEGQTPAFPEQTRAPAMTGGPSLQVEVVSRGLNHPWGLQFLPDGDLLVTERSGRVKRLDSQGKLHNVSGAPEVVAQRQGGLLDVSISPDFNRNRLVYLSYAEPREQGKNGSSVLRARLAEDGNSLVDPEVIFRQQPAWDSGLHFGSRLVWDEAGRLFVTLGERGFPRQLSQSLETHLGKVVRINADGSVPADNPYAEDDQGLSEIWSYGHRNLQGAAMHPQTGALWTIEHGPRGGDELNVPQPGLNYGWPVISYGEDYSGDAIGEGITAKAGMEQPLYYWDPVIAPGGMAFYQADLFPDWQGNLLISSLNPGGVVRLKLDGQRVTGEQRLLRELGRVRALTVGPDGALWLLTDKSNGEIIRVTPQGN